MHKWLSAKSSALLDRPFTAEKVQKAIFHTFPTKAPGLDGLPALFYQKNWNTVGERITKACLRCLNDGDSLERVNDNAIVGFECLYALRKRKRKMGSMDLKINMYKAYDRVEWVFVEKMMLKWGFLEAWIDRIMRCISLVSFSFLINGDICGSLEPSRSLSQGDPLSPYPFILCAESYLVCWILRLLRIVLLVLVALEGARMYQMIVSYF
ncbi:hypothetical protein Dsin_027758 [Dipteronia sinensis]|uniref:Reverse transcriptase n=1 Tax=Dipteronia sinensis TaxID=43782 RepID=A0AAD9ZQI4_9ROSI|nr:hypothetical protein Dsin_027758 [Dipteronia sinensis]